MTNSTIGELREALAATLTLAGVPAVAKVPEQVGQELAVVKFGGVTNYLSSFGRGVWELDLDVEILVPISGTTEHAEALLDEYLSPVGTRSIYRVVYEASKGSGATVVLDGKASDLSITEATPYSVVEIGGTRCVSSTITVHVYAK